jgi:NDP-sugar pyrophosphorylase family protein
MNVDMLTKFNLTSLIKQHNSHPSALATLAVSQRSSSRALYFDTHMNLCSWANTSTNQTKIARETQPTQAFAFSGIHVINPQILNILPFTGKFGIIDAYLELAKTHDIKGYQHTNALTIDVGKPESIIEAEKHFT